MPWLWSSLDQEFARWNCAQHPFFADSAPARERFGDYVGQFSHLARARLTCLAEASRQCDHPAAQDELARLTDAEGERTTRWVTEATSRTGGPVVVRRGTEICADAWAGQNALNELDGGWSQLVLTAYVTARISAAKPLAARVPKAAGLLEHCHEPPDPEPLKRLATNFIDEYAPVNHTAAILCARGFWAMLMGWRAWMYKNARMLGERVDYERGAGAPRSDARGPPFQPLSRVIEPAMSCTTR